MFRIDNAAVREVIVRKLQQDSNYFYRRGVLALLEGDIPTAKDWLRQSRRPPPPGWEKFVPTVRHPTAEG